MAAAVSENTAQNMRENMRGDISDPITPELVATMALAIMGREPGCWQDGIYQKVLAVAALEITLTSPDVARAFLYVHLDRIRVLRAAITRPAPDAPSKIEIRHFDYARRRDLFRRLRPIAKFKGVLI